MPAAVFLVRAVVAEPLRDKFDRWYAEDHLPWACRVFKCVAAWRCWSSIEPGVHYAFYEFPDQAAMEAAITPEALKPLIADFDRNFPTVTRSRDKLVLAEERS